MKNLTKSNIIKMNNDIAFNTHQKVLDIKRNIEGRFIELGGILKEIRDKKLYINLSYDTFEGYLAQPELALNRSTVYAIINVYETFIEGKSGQPDITEIAEIGYTKLSRISQFKSDPDFNEWIYKAKTLSLSDLGAEIREAKNPEKTEPKKSVIMEVTCPKCGFKFEVIK